MFEKKLHSTAISEKCDLSALVVGERSVATLQNESISGHVNEDGLRTLLWCTVLFSFQI